MTHVIGCTLSDGDTWISWCWIAESDGKLTINGIVVQVNGTEILHPIEKVGRQTPDAIRVEKPARHHKSPHKRVNLKGSQHP